jgi:hypothetical protein
VSTLDSTWGNILRGFQCKLDPSQGS